MDEHDSAAMPLGSSITNGERRDAQVRVLERMTELLSAQIAELAIRQASEHKRIGRMETDLSENTKITQEVRELLEAFRGGFTVLGWLGMGIKWVGGIATAIAAIYAIIYMALHNGNLPGTK